MDLVYIDDSQEPSGLCVFSALAIPHETWRQNFARIRQYRRALKHSDGIFVYKEFHATDFVAGRGRIADRVVTKRRRAQIFLETLTLTAGLSGAKLFNVALGPNQELRAFERLLNRISRNMREAATSAVLLCDEGKNWYTRLVRKMAIYNPIPSRYGGWPPAWAPTKNIPIEEIIEDPIIKQSEKSYFIQLADFCAYALLRKERPLPSKSKYGVDRAFDILQPICVLRANPRDPCGVIR